MTINCENGENIHGVGGNTVIVTEDGIFCSPACATQAEDIRHYNEACEDPDSWYWDSRQLLKFLDCRLKLILSQIRNSI